MQLFTERFIKAQKPKPSQIKPYDVREKSGKGFGITVFPSGEISFIYFYHFNGRKRRMTLGKYPHCTLAQAKELHNDALKKLRNGTDPALEKAQSKREQRDSSTIKGLITEYLEEYAEPNKRSWKEDERMLNKDVLPTWGNRKAKDITRRDVIQLLDKIKERGAPIIANRTLACVRRMFNFAIKRAILETSPCVMIEAPAKENRRDRYLSTDEIKAFWHGLKNAPMSEPVKLGLKLLLVTAQRKSEVIAATWGEFDLSTGVWTIPASKAKNGQAHRVPLSELALELLTEIKESSKGSPWLFPSKNGQAPIRGQSIDHALRRSEKTFNFAESFHVHDIRRTAATHMAGLHISGETLSRVLNHAKKGVTEQHYIKHSYDDEKRNALNAWAHKLKEIIYGEPSLSNVLNLRIA